MASRINISVDPRTLNTIIQLEETNPRVENELRIIFSNFSDSYKYTLARFEVSWLEFRQALTAVAMLLKKEQANVEFDEFALKLIQDVVSDKKSLKEKDSPIKIDKDQLLEHLSSNKFDRSLKDEQIRDAIKLLSVKHGANFSVPGAGKTTTILAVHTVLKQLGIVSKLFVVSPINAFISWEDEIKDIFKHTPLSVERLRTADLRDFSNFSKQNADVVLVNYEKLRRNIGEIIPFFVNNKVHLILDESHRVKGGNNNISYNQITVLADIAKRRDILSGTPMPQSYLDLVPQFNFLWPGENIIPQINNRDDDALVTRVNSAIDGLFVRTTKDELGLDDPIIKYTTISMGPVQAELYKLFKSEVSRQIAGLDKPTLYNFRRIGRSVVKLLQAATNPMLLSASDEYEDQTLPFPANKEFWELLDDFSKFEKPVKIEYLIKRVQEITSANPKNKVLIWSYFVRNIQILEVLLKSYNPVTIYGGVPSGSDEDEENREGRIRKFHEDDSCRVMIANPQACGEGISLHKVCHHAIYLDRNFNAAFFLQSIDRIHRLGLEKGIETNVEILITENSIDELLITRLNDKIMAMGAVLDDPYLQSLAYDPADIPKEDEVGIDAKDFEAIKDHVSK